MPHSPSALARAGLILIVDDDPDIRDAITFALEMLGHQVVTAANGQEALDTLVTETPDLILLDLNMPVMNGWDFCATRQQRPQVAAIPVVVMSARVNLASRPDPLHLAGVLEKPFSLDQLFATVAATLQ